jgi:ABC-2 type transport system permease protein
MTKSASSSDIVHFSSQGTVIGRFVARRTLRSAILWAFIFGIYVASKAIGFVDLYPTALARQKIVETFSNNIGIELLLGKAPQTATTAAYVAWNTVTIMVVIGAIWMLLLATKYIRGEEDSGRQEALLSGQTTARRAALSVVLGLSSSLAIFYAILALLLVGVGKSHGVDFSVPAALFFALDVTVSIAMFMMIAACASELLPTRSRATSATAIILGVCFLMRAVGDITSLHWLLDINPLGWAEKMQPLAASHPVWLIPILGLIVILALVTVYLAGKRDYGESIIADTVTSKPRYRLLNSPLGLAIRLSKNGSIGWLSGMFIAAVLYGLITRTTGQIFSQSASFQKVVNRLTEHARVSSALSFLGIIFFLQMVFIMAYTASSMTALRRDEADGYLDNYFVRPVSRLRWLSGRALITLTVIGLAGLLTTIGVWAAVASQHIGIPFNTLLLASINAIIPALLLMGVGIYAFGVLPRKTSLIVYGILAWSLLIEMVSSGIAINHWLLDTSVLHQVVFAPAANPRWQVNLMVCLVAVLLVAIGALRLQRRDIINE